MDNLLFNNKYRIPSARLQNWNYANEAMYFVTICTRYRAHYFGEIIDHPPSLLPTEIGKIAHEEWYKSVSLRPDMNLELGEFIVMPNHIHGIVIIGPNTYNTPGFPDSIRRDAKPRVCTNSDQNPQHHLCFHPQSCVDARHRVSTVDMDFGYKNKFAPQSKNLASIIRGYKSAVTTHAKKCGIEFGWQPRFHDHVIRSLDEYYRISDYIVDNTSKWLEDKFYRMHSR